MKVSKLVDILTMDHKPRVNVEGFMLEQQLAKQVEAGGKAGKQGKRLVMGLVIADATWIIHCSLWSPTVEQFEDTLTQASVGLGDEEFVKVSLSYMDVVVVTKTPKPVVKLQGTRQTSVKVTGKGPRRVAPDPAYIIKSFKDMGQPEIQATLQGIFTAIDDPIETRAGAKMRPCVLTGDDNRSVRIMVHGGMAEDPDVEIGQRVTVFYAKSQEGLQPNQTGFYWVYDDSWLLFHGKALRSPGTGHIEEIGEMADDE